MKAEEKTTRDKAISKFLLEFDDNFLATTSPIGDSYLFTKDQIPLLKFEHQPLFKIIINSHADITVLIVVSNKLEEYKHVFGIESSDRGNGL